jgi:hypothetical protein
VFAASAVTIYAGDDAPIASADTAVGSAAVAKAPAVAPGADDSAMPSRPTFITPAAPPIDHASNDSSVTIPPETQEIPQAMPDETPVATIPPGTVPSPSDLSHYLHQDDPYAAGVGNLHTYLPEGEETSAIGFAMRESRCRLKTGEQTDGLLILKVDKDSPAARAGLRPYRGGAQHALQALAIGAGMAFPPAMLLTMVALPMIEYTEAGKSYDMITGVDGMRVTNFGDFEERMNDVKPGELVYFNLVRDGKRVQIAIPVPALATSASN